MSFFAELRRRRVFRVAVLYGVVSWVITEVSSVVLPALNLPEWTITLIVVLLIIGFPIAMIFAWIFDIGPAGIERTAPLETTRPPGRRHYALYGGLMLGATLALGALLYFRGWDGLIDRGPRDSIAVLPFENLSRDPENDYFSDGIAEELLNLLARVPNLQVAARTSSFAFKDQAVDVRTVAQQLGVETILEGTVRWAQDGERVRITAQLIDAETGYHLWSQTYDRRLEDIFAVQDEIATQIVKALQIQLASEGQEAGQLALGQPPTTDVDAYQLYLQGRHFWKRRGADSIRKSIDLYQAALGRDPGFARAHAALAAAYVLLPEYTEDDPEEPFALATRSARQALALDANLGEAHAVLAMINSERDDFIDAEAGFFFAKSLDPNEPTARQWYATLLVRMGRLDDALSEALEAYELDPTSPIISATVATVYFVRGENALALEYAQKAIDLGLHAKQSGLRATVFLREGRDDEALQAYEDASEEFNVPVEAMSAFVAAYRDPENAPDLTVAPDGTPLPIPTNELFMVNVLTRQVDAAYTLAERAIEEMGGEIASWFWLPEAASFRQDPRFGSVAERLGLVDYWKQYGGPDQCQLDGDSLSCT